MENIISTWPILAKEQCVKKDDGVCVPVYFNIRKEIGVKLENKHWYEHVPRSVKTSNENKIIILWNQKVQNDRTIPNNKSGIQTVKINKGYDCQIDVAIPGDRHVINKEDEKILKYKDLRLEIQPMWNVKAKLIPVLVGATETISKSLKQYLSNKPGKHEIKELQKTALLDAAHTNCGKC